MPKFVFSKKHYENYPKVVIESLSEVQMFDYDKISNILISNVWELSISIFEDELSISILITSHFWIKKTYHFEILTKTNRKFTQLHNSLLRTNPIFLPRNRTHGFPQSIFNNWHRDGSKNLILINIRTCSPQRNKQFKLHGKYNQKPELSQYDAAAAIAAVNPLYGPHCWNRDMASCESLVRFRCVSKSLKSLTSHASFVKLHLQR